MSQEFGTAKMTTIPCHHCRVPVSQVRLEVGFFLHCLVCGRTEPAASENDRARIEVITVDGMMRRGL